MIRSGNYFKNALVRWIPGGYAARRLYWKWFPGGPKRHEWHSERYVAEWVSQEDQRAGDREPLIRRLIDRVPFPRHAPLRALDVAAGHGPMSRHLLDAFPNATVTLVDYSPLML